MTPQAKEYIDRIREEFLSGNDYAVATILEELNEDHQLYMEVFATFPASMRRQLKEIWDNFDPSPYCQYCGARRKEDCNCGPIADNN